ncbi:MAG: phosphoacceptor domain-containing protein [Phormidesmis priestleyi]|uniref:histidine kinase n=1 Tax=Phormidesmis priestleyi TaxID=268141 RepID=A0A2W4XDU9_9CYAN|nr:MAG: phosphoacceptor domain-containing protein [Phormidesmis priestleyi]
MSLSKSLAESLSGSVAMFDVLSAIAQPIYIKNNQHQWLYVNEAAAMLIGLSAEAIVGRSEADFLPQPLAQQIARQDSTFFATGQESSIPLIFHSDCQMIAQHKLIEIEGQMALVSTLKDVTAIAHIQQTNKTLSQELKANRAELKTALKLESTLKRLTDRVRDSLDEQHILQTAVDALVDVLHVKAANTALYDLEQGTSTVYYECCSAGYPSMRGRVSQMEAYSEVYHQLLDGSYLQFCSIAPHPERGRVSMFAAPIRDDRGVLGDLWLINDVNESLAEIDIRLVQQVTNQCAIAIRQARLYQESQSQVRELERVNTLKDDFLSTVSHELRTPVTSMRVALQLLGITLNQAHDLDQELAKPHLEQSRIARYYRILAEECEREISLINDLLDLQRLDVGNHPMIIQPIGLANWLPNLVNGFQPRAKSRQQMLTLTIPADLPELRSDLASIERVLAELINNACKYTPPDHSIHIAIAGEQSIMRFSVVNTGVEIAEEERLRIFDKFYRVPSADPWKQGGTGLGLALVQKLVGHLEGTITVESSHGQTAFLVELPLAFSSQ